MEPYEPYVDDEELACSSPVRFAGEEDAYSSPVRDQSSVSDLLRRLEVLEQKKAQWTSQARSLVSSTEGQDQHPQWTTLEGVARSRWLKFSEVRALLSLPEPALRREAAEAPPQQPASGTLAVLFVDPVEARLDEDGYGACEQVGVANLQGQWTPLAADTADDAALVVEVSASHQDALRQRRAYHLPDTPRVILLEYRFDATEAKPWTQDCEDAALWWERAAERRSRSAKAAVLAMERERLRRVREDVPGSEEHAHRLSGARRLSADVRSSFPSSVSPSSAQESGRTLEEDAAAEQRWREGWAAVQAITRGIDSSEPRDSTAAREETREIREKTRESREKAREKEDLQRAQSDAVRREQTRRARERRDTVDMWRRHVADEHESEGTTPVSPPPAATPASVAEPRVLSSYDAFRGAMRRSREEEAEEVYPLPRPRAVVAAAAREAEEEEEAAAPVSLPQHEARVYKQLAVEAERRRQERRHEATQALRVQAALTERRRVARHDGAVAIQRLYRGGAVRSQLRLRKEAALLLVAAMRYWLMRLRRHRLYGAVARLVATRRGRVCRTDFKQGRSAAVLLQRLARRIRRRRVERALPVLQGGARCWLARREVARRRLPPPPPIRRPQSLADALKQKRVPVAEAVVAEEGGEKQEGEGEEKQEGEGEIEEGEGQQEKDEAEAPWRAAEPRPSARPRLDVQLIQARDLPPPLRNFFGQLSLGRKTRRCPPARNSLSPRWQFETSLPLPGDWRGQSVQVEVLDDDRFSDNVLVGVVSVPLSLLDATPQREISQWFPLLRKGARGKDVGEVRVRMRVVGGPPSVSVSAPKPYRRRAEVLQRLGRQPPTPRPVSPSRSVSPTRRAKPVFEKLDWSKVQARTSTRWAPGKLGPASRAAARPTAAKTAPIDLSKVRSRVDSKRPAGAGDVRRRGAVSAAAAVARARAGPPVTTPAAPAPAPALAPAPAPASPVSRAWSLAALERTMMEQQALHPTSGSEFFLLGDVETSVPRLQLSSRFFREYAAGRYAQTLERLEREYAAVAP